MNIGDKKFLIKIHPQEIVPTIIFIIIVILMGGNSQNPDIKNYLIGYNNINYDIVESPIYVLLKLFSFNIGLSFELFRLFIYFLGCLNLRIVSVKLKVNSLIYWIFYFIALMMIDATQTYNFVGMTFLLLGVSLLITEEKKPRFKFIVVIILAAGFHIAFLFYLPFVFIYNQTNRKQLLKIYLGVLSVFTVFSLIGNVASVASLLQGILNRTGLTNYQSYLVSRTRYGHLYPIVSHLIGCSFTIYIYYKAEKLNLEMRKYAWILLLLELYGIFAFPMFRIQLTLGRLTRNLELIPCIIGIMYAKERNDINIKRLVAFFLLFLSIIFGYFFIYMNYMDVIVKPFFDFNWILGRGI